MRATELGVAGDGPTMPVLYTARQVAKILGLGKTKVYDMMKSGELPVVILGQRSKRVPAVALMTWIEEHTSGGYEAH